jgi:hypothetical protein
MRYETITTSRLLNDCIVSYTSQVVSAPLGTIRKNGKRIIEDDYIELITTPNNIAEDSRSTPFRWCTSSVDP